MAHINSSTPLRSMLFTPGSSEKMLSKSLTSPSDASLYDLEDSVSEDMKSKARELVGVIIKENKTSNESPPIILVRVNEVNSEHFGKDMDEITTQGLDGIFLPKPETEADVRKADAIITKLEMERKLEVNSIGIILQMESALGIYNCYNLCKSAKRVVGVNLGSAEDADLCRDLGAQWTPDGNTLHYSRSKVLLEARAAKMPHPTDGVYMDLQNDDGCRQDAEIARLLGYTGKAAIHP
ncbi:MAG: aldolase/citrate lyase family protein, partial [Nitrospinota bacterium]|nr:aldolase/citrate lyase family protein [Nitrospinota bacterium]